MHREMIRRLVSGAPNRLSARNTIGNGQSLCPIAVPLLLPLLLCIVRIQITQIRTKYTLSRAAYLPDTVISQL